jgi:class 3 adenylate cyclase
MKETETQEREQDGGFGPDVPFQDSLIAILKTPFTPFTLKIWLLFGSFGAVAHILFYFFCRSMGMWENFTIRLVVSLTCASAVFFVRKREPGTLAFIWTEGVGFFTLPVMFSYFLLHNDLSEYWQISLIFSGWAYGIASARPYLSFIGFPVGCALGGIIYIAQTGQSGVYLNRATGPFVVAWLSTLISALLRLGFEVYYLMIANMQRQKVKAAEAWRRKRVLEEKNKELQTRNSIISTFVRPSVLREVELGEDPRLHTPVIVSKTIMICDMRNFTPWSSQVMDPEAQAQFLSKYFNMMMEPVFECGGEVDKLMGDALMGVFPDGNRAIQAALKMRERLQVYNRQLLVAGMEKIANVICIAKGSVLEANIGSEQKLDRTWIGTAVNVAARLESITKLYNVEIVADSSVMEDAPYCKDCRLIDCIKVKGCDEQLDIFELYGHLPRGLIDMKNATRELLLKGIRLYFTPGHITEASKVFLELLSTMPRHRFNENRCSDSIVLYYATRCMQRLGSDDTTVPWLDNDAGCHTFNPEIMPRNWQNQPLSETIDALSNALEKKE